MHRGMYLHYGQLQSVSGLRTEPSQHISGAQVLIGTQLQVALLNTKPDMHRAMTLHCGQLQLLYGSRAEPSQQRSLVQAFTGSQLQVSLLNT